ncbi:uncharacterized protein LOC118780292 [Megalops cyprinoides]|uniref:uncharacterized protein LOC118780292 n=1 Tax=Megalops cyprinoides TaxID=118141 RepID=UPI001865275D|nr:uncharacterized protein LOC118780292 [Megalops cyprinoides]
MDDFDYSVQISELDWKTFFQECEECDLLPPALAGLEDSGMSDADDASSSLSSRDPQAVQDSDLLEPDDPIDGPPDSEGCPVENYLSACDLPCPEDVLSCSEEDRHLESVNVFFERLKSMTEGGSLHTEAKPKGTEQGEELPKHPARPVGLSEPKCWTDSRQRLTGAESTGSEQEDEVGGSANLAVELVIREDEWSVEPATEERKQEQEAQSYKPSKDAVLSSEVLSPLFSNNECDNKTPERKFQKPRDHKGADGAARGDEMAGQPPPRRAASPSGPYSELHSDPDILLGEGTAETAERHPLKSQKKKQKERWFVSVGGSQESSKEHASPVLRKKRKKLGASRDSLAVGHGCEGESTESETEAETFQQGAAAQGKGQAKHDRTACSDETGSGRNSFSVHQTDGEKDFPKQQKLGTGPHSPINLQHSHKNSIPAKTAERDALSAFEPTDNIPQNSHSSGITIDSTVQQPTGLYEPETNGGSEQYFATDSHRLSIVEESLPELNHMTKEQKLQRNSEVDKNASDQQASLELSCSTETLQCDKPFTSDTISGSEDSRRLDPPGYGHTSAHEHNKLPFSQESSDLDNTGSPEVSPHREFLIEVPYAAELSGPAGSSLSLNNTGSQGSADTICITEQDEERPPEYQEVEDTCDIPIDGNDSTHLQPTPEDSHTGNIIPQTNSAFSALENDQPATAANNQSYLPLEELKTSDEQGKLRQSDPASATASPDPCHTAIPQLSFPTKISSENDAKDGEKENSEPADLAASEKDKA